VGCIAGALSVSEFEDGLKDVGLVDVTLTPTHSVADGMYSAIVKATKPADYVAPQTQPRIGAVSRNLPVSAAVACCGDSCCA
jgi:hypothetical protein